MALVIVSIAGGMAYLLTRLAAKGRPLHMDYAEKAAAVDGELVDVVQNMNIVRAFGSILRERARFARQVRVVTFKDVNVEELDKPELQLPD